MDYKKISLGAAAYVLVTFPLAVLWHVVLFKETYERFGYIEGEPNFALGLTTIVTQGVVLSALYPLVRLRGKGPVRGLKYAAILGAFFWTSHVLAFVAKQVVEPAFFFVAMETVYLVLQFGIFGVFIGLIHNGRKESP